MPNSVRFPALMKFVFFALGAIAAPAGVLADTDPELLVEPPPYVEPVDDREYSAGITEDQVKREILCSEVGVSPEECSTEAIEEIAPGASAKLTSDELLDRDSLSRNPASE